MLLSLRYVCRPGTLAFAIRGSADYDARFETELRRLSHRAHVTCFRPMNLERIGAPCVAILLWSERKSGQQRTSHQTCHRCKVQANDVRS